MMVNYKTNERKLFRFRKAGGKILETDIILLGKTYNMMLKGFSPIILICGPQRMGKSFVGVWLSMRILKFFHPTFTFDPEKYTFYDPVDSVYAIENHEREPFIIDEAGALFHKQEWYKRVTLALDKIIQTQGYLCNMYIFISPFGSDIAKAFRKHFDFILKVRRRGIVTVKRVPKKYDDLSDKPPKAYMVEQIKLRMGDIPPAVWSRYEKYSIQQKKELYNSFREETEKAIKRLDPFGRPVRRSHGHGTPNEYALPGDR